MFGATQQELVKGLANTRDRICCYIGITCDCKYGIRKRGKSEGYYTGEQTGCPEVAQALALIKAMTADEFETLCDRARVIVIDMDWPEPICEPAD